MPAVQLQTSRAEETHTCVGAGEPAKVSGAVGAPEHKGRRAHQALREQLLHVVDIPRPRRSQLERVEARVPCPKLCSSATA